jgi:myo-inositol-1(or 4)-monophosphatase
MGFRTFNKRFFMQEMAWIERMVRTAGAHMKDAFAKTHESGFSLKGQQDYLTQTDGEVEAMVKQALAKDFPNDAFLGEETGGVTDSAVRLWIVDPVDGTANFARGVPHFCISLALLENGLPALGAIYDPVHDELFVAAKGQGAFLNGVHMRVSDVPRLNLASVEVGWSQRLNPPDYLCQLSAVIEAGAAIRRAGSGALGLAYVAAGRCDAYVELHINSWDVAAGLLLVSEAGGVVNDFWTPGALKNGNPVLACAASLATEMSAVTGIAL